MTRPRRWLDAPDEAPEGARALLDAAGSPDRAARDRVWTALQGGSAPPSEGAPPGAPHDAGPGGAAGTAGAAGAALASGAGAKKLAAISALIAMGAVATVELPRASVSTAARPVSAVSPPTHARSVAPPPVRAPVAEPREAPAPSAPAARSSLRTSSTASVVERSARVIAARPDPASLAVAPAQAPTVAEPPSSVDDGGLDAERELLRTAYERLDGAPAEALARVIEHERRFAQGHLGHEREVVRVEALHKLGRDDEARARIDAFLQACASSTQAPRMRALRDRLGPETIR